MVKENVKSEVYNMRNIKKARLFSRLHNSISVFSEENIELMRELLPEEDWSLITRVATSLILLDEKINERRKS